MAIYHGNDFRASRPSSRYNTILTILCNSRAEGSLAQTSDGVGRLTERILQYLHGKDLVRSLTDLDKCGCT
jgi:hypothetical protein